MGTQRGRTRTAAMETALHEAAHALAAYRFGRDLAKTTIKPNPQREVLGVSVASEEWVRFEMVDGRVSSSVDIESVEEEVLILLAGYAATVRLGESRERARAGAESDFEKARDLLRLLDHPQRDAEDHLEKHLRKAQEFVAEPRNRRAIAAIAKELMEWETLSGQEVECIVDVADGSMPADDFTRHRSGMRRCNLPERDRGRLADRHAE